VTGTEIVQAYLSSGYRIVVWPAIGDSKGPREEGWTVREYTIDDYSEGNRVGLMTGVDIGGNKFLVDIDLDWAPGARMAAMLLPPTNFAYGRASKPLSHLLYTTEIALASMRFEDIDKTALFELRGTKANGEVGLESMVPPSVWSKEGTKEPLQFVHAGDPAHLFSADFKRKLTHVAIAQILAKHLGVNGFGHDVRLMFAGFLLRLKIAPEDVIKIGEAMSGYCNNLEVHDVRVAVTSTETALQDKNKKVKGGPALARHLGKDGKKIIERINEWLGNEEDFLRDAKGNIIAKHQGNVIRAMRLLGHELSFNQFSESPLIDGQPMEDFLVEHIYLQIDNEFGFLPQWDFFKQVIRHEAWINGFHPVRQYLDSLVWDGVKRLDTWLIECAGVEDSRYTRTVSRLFLVAGVKRIKHPGCKYDEMMVWESTTQGTEKSSAAQALCPNASWFSDDLPLNVDSKQIMEKTLGKWIIEASDLSGKRKTDIDHLKATMSRQVDGPARMAYAHFPQTRPRHFVLLGTTNSTAYLNDATGARRFWPMTVKRFDVAWIRANRDQLWAEAVVAESEGESIRMPEDLWPAATEQQERRREIDPWESILYAVLMNIPPSHDGKRRVAANTLWDSLGIQVERRDRGGALRIADVMQRFGFKRTTVRIGKESPQTGYLQEDVELLKEPIHVEVAEDRRDKSEKPF